MAIIFYFSQPINVVVAWSLLILMSISSIQNTEASLSNIRDTDFAKEAANLAKSKILTQAGSTMLAQANNLSQNIQSLIQ
ncbi:hypothetical protein CMK18_15710 [Candidatus Poribacteria bacterium]|nr:hypothetical protein [Candidatus Poribacteria bacterium]